MALAGPAERAFAGLLRLLPPDLRERHGREIKQVFRAEWGQARSRSERFTLWCRTAAGLVTTAAPEYAASLRQDVAYALRGLWRSPSFAVPAILILSLSIGATIAVLGLVNVITFRPLPFAGADRLLYVDVWSTTPNGPPQRFRMLGSYFQRMRKQGRLFEAIAAHRRRTVSLTTPDGSVQVPAALVSEGWSDLRVAAPALGRLFTAAEESAGSASAVAVVSRRVWTNQLGAPATLERASLRLDDRLYRVVGVMPDTFYFPYESEVWIPSQFADDAQDLLVIARRRQDVSLRSVNQAMAEEASRIADWPGTAALGGLSARSLREGVVAGGDRLAWLLLSAVAALLLIAILNVACLFSVRFASRRREFVIRSALGANQRRQLRQCRTETSVLFALAAALGLVVAYWLTSGLTFLVPVILRTQLTGNDIPLDGRVVVCSAIMVFALGRVFGSIAVRHAAPADGARVLDEDGLATAPVRRGRPAAVVASAQVALAIVLGSCASFLVSGVIHASRMDLGFATANMLTFQLDLSSERLASAESRLRMLDAVALRIRATPGVAGVALSTVNPLCCYDYAEPVIVEGRPSPTEPELVHHRDVSPEFFEVMGIPLERGRTFNEHDTAEASPVVIIDRRLADRYWPGLDPIGRRLTSADRPDIGWMTVVGVASRIEDSGAFPGAWYVPLTQHAAGPSSRRVHLLIRTVGDPMSLAPEIRRAASAASPQVGSVGIHTIEQLKADRTARDRFAAIMLSAFAGFGLLLAAAGLYGVSARGVHDRLPEFGIRMAFGSTRASILRLAIRDPMRLVLAGCLAGSGAAVVTGAVLERTVFNATTAEPAAIAGALAVAACITATACGIPAARAALTPPLESMRRRL